MDDSILREQLVNLLNGGQAYVPPGDALKEIRPELRHTSPAPGFHSIWEILEHLRIAQEDILRYTMDASWQSPEWPDGYWPKDIEKVTDEMWEMTVKNFNACLSELQDLAQNKSIDLTSRISHAGEHTYLREILIAADHNAYHIGQIVQARKLLNNWPK